MTPFSSAPEDINLFPCLAPEVVFRSRRGFRSGLLFLQCIMTHHWLFPEVPGKYNSACWPGNPGSSNTLLLLVPAENLVANKYWEKNSRLPKRTSSRSRSLSPLSHAQEEEGVGHRVPPVYIPLKKTDSGSISDPQMTSRLCWRSRKAEEFQRKWRGLRVWIPYNNSQCLPMSSLFSWTVLWRTLGARRRGRTGLFFIRLCVRHSHHFLIGWKCGKS